jgi:hypothetical protein
MTEDWTEFIATPVKKITAAQLQAWKDAQDLLPPELNSVGPPQFVAPDAQYASVLESVVDGVWIGG